MFQLTTVTGTSSSGSGSGLRAWSSGGCLARNANRGVRLAFSEPVRTSGLVQTGLHLIELPTIVWHETDYSIYVMRQASRRSRCIRHRGAVAAQSARVCH